jgi:hypothetical protein
MLAAHPEERDLNVVLCVHRNGVASWSVQLPPELDGETFHSISFDGPVPKLVTEDGREYSMGEEIYANYGEATMCDRHVLVEFDSFLNIRREYPMAAGPVAQPARAYGV